MTNQEREVDPTDLENELSEEERANSMPTCREPHAENGNANCTGVCQRRKDHIDAGHRDQFGHWY